MRIVLTGLAAALLASSLLASGAVAQTAAPAAAGEKQIEGQLKSLDPTGTKLTLADGTEFMIPGSVRLTRAELKPGAKVKVAYEERGGQKVLKHVEVAK